MEHRGHVIKAQQGRLARTWLGKVSDVDDDRLGAKQATLIDEAVLPGSAIFVRTLKVISVKKRQRFSVCIEHFKDAHVRLINGQVFSFLESDAIEFVCRKE